MRNSFAIVVSKLGGIYMKKGHYIFVKSYKHPKTGKIMMASDYGKKAFRLLISK